MDERYERVPYRFGRQVSGHPGILVGESRDRFLLIPMTHSRKRGSKMSNRKFAVNPNPYDEQENYWESRVVEVPKSAFLDYSRWVLSKEDESRIDGFLRGNGKARLHFQ